MRSANKVHVVFLQESGHNIWSKCEGNTAVVLAPASDVLVRVRPKQIAEQSAVGDLAKVSFLLDKPAR